MGEIPNPRESPHGHVEKKRLLLVSLVKDQSLGQSKMGAQLRKGSIHAL